MPVEHSPVQSEVYSFGLPIRRKSPTSKIATSNLVNDEVVSVPPVQESVKPKQIKFKAPSGKLAAVTRKQNELMTLLNDKCRDSNLITNLFTEYKQKFQILHDECASQILPQSEDLVREEWWSTRSYENARIEIEVNNYLSYLSPTLRKPETDQRSKISAAVSMRSNTSSARVKLAERKAKLMAEKDYQEKMNKIEEKQLELNRQIKEAEFEKRVIENNVLEEELNNLDRLADQLEIGGSLTSSKTRYNSSSESLETRSSELTHKLERRNPDLIKVLNKQNELTMKIAKHQEKAELPRKTLTPFDGKDVTNYFAFKQGFRKIVADKCDNSADKLYYLEQFTESTAKQIVRSCCNMADTDAAYSRALKLLDEEFGNEHSHSNAYIEKLENWKQIKSEDGEGLRELSIFLTTCENNLESMTSLNYLNSPKEILSITTKLPFELKKKWREKTLHLMENNKPVNFKEFAKFIRFQAKLINQPIFGKLKDVGQTKETSQYRNKKSLATGTTTTDLNEMEKSYAGESLNKANLFCLYCKRNNHVLNKCYFFQKIENDKKIEFLKIQGLCFACLEKGHSSRGCINRETCQKCKKRHPTVLHRDNYNYNKETPREEPKKREDEQKNLSTNKATNKKTLCATVPIKIKVAGQQKSLVVYAALDTCSTSTFIDEKILRDLGVEGTNTEISLNTMEKQNCKMETKIINNLELYNMDGVLKDCIPVVYAQKHWPFTEEDSPNKEDIEKISHLPFKFVDAKVSILIGMDRPQMLKPIEVVDGDTATVYATLHELGWALCGPVEKDVSNVINNKIMLDNSIEDQIKSMFDNDYKDSHILQKEMSQSDRIFESIMKTSIKHQSDLHYEVNLPIKSNIELPDNRSQAYYCFKSLERKFDTNESLQSDYKQFMQMMVDNNYIEKVPTNEVNDSGWYLTHHAVYHKQKNKIRVVFNCSLKYKGVCLNDFLHQGPDMNNSLLGVLIRFRQNKVAVMGDIAKMFYQVNVSPEHRNMLRLYWYDENLKLCQYRLTVHLFGATSSPAVAGYAMRQTVLDNPDTDETVKAAVLRNFYVDDLLWSTSTVEDAENLLLGVKDLLLKGGFSLAEFVSNSPELNENLKSKGLSNDLKTIPIGNQTERALGLQWNTLNDTLGFKINLDEKPVTRRGILSQIHGIYDPLGISAPAVLHAKKIFQDTCSLNLDWDEELPLNIKYRWLEWINNLKELKNYEFSRCCKPDHTANIQLHYFSDGSETAYGAVVYVRFVDNEGNIICSPLLAKSRLNPLNNTAYKTIPRIELNGAKLSVILKQTLDHELDYNIDEEYFWTDSSTVLKYLQNDDKRYVRFVANRISYILSSTNKGQWNYVPSKMNPADHITRGVSISNFLNLKDWTYGPEFLWKPKEDWPPQLETLPISEDLEIKAKSKCLTSIPEPIEPTDKLLASCSSFYMLKRRVAWFLRIKAALLKKATTGNLTLQELKDAEKYIIIYIQGKYFSSTISNLKSKNSLNRHDNLLKLQPFLDNEGLLRVGGRLNYSNLNYSSKHPVILPNKCKIVTYLVSEIHKSLGHSGRQTMVSVIRNKYWIIGLNSCIRKLMFCCPICRKINARPFEQKMASLPQDRVQTDEPAFTRVGLDYFGPFEVVNGRKNQKRYGVIFTCLSSRATHIEMAYSLTTDSFINALRRFIARRGNVVKIRSDNGTNITSGNKELKKAVNEWNNSVVESWMLQHSIEWQFNPPAASHFGGVYEREIRTIRKVLHGILHEQPLKLSDELLNTLFCEIESILNCRPLTEQSNDINDLEALTPNHLLLLNSGITFPPGLFTKHDNYVARRWKQVQYLSDLFWQRYRKQYLPLLQERQKWHRSNYTYKVGDLVILTDQNLPRNQWSLGKITAVYPDIKGVVRVVKIKVAKYKNEKSPNAKFGCVELERPTSKIILIQSSD